MAETVKLVPPSATKIPFTHERVTGPAQDPWAWLRDPNDPQTIAYLSAENKYAESWFKLRAPLIGEVFHEIKTRIVEDDTTPPTEFGNWWYDSQTISGSGYVVHRRGPTKETSGAHVILDENVEATPFEFFSLGTTELSPDHNFLAWSFETDGSERFSVRIRDLSSGQDRHDRLEDTSNANLAWSADAQYLFYVTHDEAMRPNKVWRHRIGEAQPQDVVVLSELDERFNVNVATCRSGEWIIVESHSRITSECYLVSAHDPLMSPVLVRARQDGVEYRIDHWGDRFVILTNLDAIDFRVMSAPLNKPESWTEILPHVLGQRIASIDPFADHLIIQDWHDAQQRIRVMHRDLTITTFFTGTEPHDLKIDECPQWNTRVLRYTHQSLVSPPAVYEHDVVTDERVVLKQQVVPSVDLSNYIASREWTTADVGTQVPIDIVRHKNTPVSGTAPGLLYAYGAYEYSVPPWFSVARLSLLDRGWIWALAHPRGGGECGRQWYLDGKLLNKKNTFEDVNACARHLYKNLIGHNRLALRGGSAGGLMVGACVTTEPTLYGAAIAEVPFVDVVTTMSDPTLPLTINEWEEWGDPRNEPAASYMLSYSPYDNTKNESYPPMMVTAGLNDPRVSFHEPAKWVAKLRSIGSVRQHLLFKCEMSAGHAGKSNRYDQWRDEAEVMAFLIATLGQKSK